MDGTDIPIERVSPPPHARMRTGHPQKESSTSKRMASHRIGHSLTLNRAPHFAPPSHPSFAPVLLAGRGRAPVIWAKVGQECFRILLLLPLLRSLMQRGRRAGGTVIIFFARHLIVIVTHVCSLQLAAHAVLRRAVITEDDDDAMARLPARRGTLASRGQGARSLLLSLSGGELPRSQLPSAYHTTAMKVNIAPKGTGSG